MKKKLSGGYTIESVDRDSIFMCGTYSAQIYMVSYKTGYWIAFTNTYLDALAIVRANRDRDKK